MYWIVSDENTLCLKGPHEKKFKSFRSGDLKIKNVEKDIKYIRMIKWKKVVKNGIKW